MIEKLILAPALDSLLQSDREDEMTHWLEQHGEAPTEARVASILDRAKRSSRLLTDQEIREVVRKDIGGPP